MKGHRVVISLRSDGLGERLNGILNGIRLAELLNADFKFTWSDRGRENVLHAIVPAHEFFSEDFCRRHLVESWETGRAVELDGRGMTRDDLESRIRSDGVIIAPRIGLREILSAEHFAESTFDLRDCFATIDFDPHIEAAVTAARVVDIPEPMTGLHLRSGDVFYGVYRKYVHYTYKGLSLPIAKGMISAAQRRGETVVALGQDEEILVYLRDTLGVVLGSDLAPRFGSRSAQAMFDLCLLARSSRLMAGSSGFAKQASWISGVPVESPGSMFTWRQQQALSLSDLATNEDEYPPLQVAFAYWYMFYYGRQFRRSRTAVAWLARARRFDPDNELYPLVMAALNYRMEEDEEGDRLIADRLLLDSVAGSRETCRVFVAKTGGRFNLAEYHPHFRAAAQRGSRYADLLGGVLDAASGRTSQASAAFARGSEALPPEVMRAVPR